MSFSTNSIERFRITSSGNIGVNKTTPKEWYNTYRTIQIYDGGYIAGSSDDSFVAIGANNYLDTGGTYDYTNTDYASQLYQVDGQLLFRNAPSGTADTAITWTERLRIDSAGNIGISESTPDSKLDILYSTTTNSNTENLIHLRTDPGAGYVSRGLFVKIGRDGVYDNSAAHYDIVGSSGNSGFHAFEVQGNEKLRITKDGTVRLPDNGKLTLGAGDDLQIWSDNTDQYIRGEQNQLIVRSNNLRLQSYLGENYIHCAMNNAVSLYYDNVKKFETQTSGVVIHEDTDKTIRFTGGIGEIGNVTGFQATNTAGSDIVDFGMRGTTLRFATGSAERLRITSGGRLLYGNHLNDRGAELQYEGSEHACIGIHRNTNSHGAPSIQLSSSRGTGAGSNTIVQNNDYLGMINFKGADGSDLAPGAYITAIVDGSPGSNDMPTRLGFWTSADGSQSPTERLRITSDGIHKISTAGDTQDGTFFSSLTINNTGSNTYSRIRFDRSGVARFGLTLRNDDKLCISNLYQGGSVTANDAAFVMDAYSKIGINEASPTARLDINHPHTEQGLVVRSRYGNIATAMVKFDGDPSADGGDGNVLHLHGGSSRTDSEILHIDSTGVGDIFDIRGDGLTRVYKQLQLEHSSNVAKIIFNEYGANDPKAQIEMDQINGDNGQLIFRTQQSGTLAQRLRISSGGTLYYNGEEQTVASGGGSAHKVLVTSAYEEWHFTWSGTSSRTATFTCPSYFHAEVIYTSHQTNGGSDIHRYVRGKWANNHTTHTWVQHENVGSTWALTSFSISATHNGGNQANGKLTISETYGSGSLSTRAVIMRIYYGASGLGWDIA